MSDLREFVRRVCENPADDTVRMVFADWLDDHDEHDRAEFIRDQVEWRPGSRDFDLLDHNWDRWFPGVRRHDEKGFERTPGGLAVPLMSGSSLVFSRGFVHEVRFVNIAAYTSVSASGYWGEQPVCRVKIYGRVPQLYPRRDGSENWRWFFAEKSREAPCLPDALWGAFHDHPPHFPSLVRRGESWEFPSIEAAYEALSAGAVALGRKLAGLPVEFGRGVAA